jgi:DMSO/TMAO reductase YedYZ heme-binding membrane subunit
VNEQLWYFSRATGVVSIVMLTAVVVLGMVIAGRRRPHTDQATVVMALHRWLGLGVSTFVVAHVVTAIAESFVSIDWISAVVPFTSGYAPVWVGFGTLALDLLAAVAVTSYLRHRLPERGWRVVHLLSYALWPLALVHGIALGTSDEPVLRGITIACAVAGAAAVAWRLGATHDDRARRESVAAQGWS